MNPSEGQQRITVYGADWCGYTIAARELLDAEGVPYRYVNVEQDPDASEWVKAQNGGQEIKPTLLIDGDVLSAPEADVLDRELRQRGLVG